MQCFRSEADVLRRDTDELMQQLMDKLDTVVMDVQPEIYADYKRLKADIKEQRHEKGLLLKHLDKLKRETEEQRQKVKFCAERIEAMEDNVGMIAKTEAYKNDFIPKSTLSQPDDDLAGPFQSDRLLLNIRSSNKEI